jgi:hypothetical protein
MRKHDEDAQHRAHAIDCGVRMQAARALQLHRSAHAAEQDEHAQGQAEGDDEVEMFRPPGGRNGPGRKHRDGQCAADSGQRQPAAPLARSQQRAARNVHQRMRITRRRRHVHIFLAPAPEDDGGDEHEDAGNAECPGRAPGSENARHQQGGEERTEVDGPVEGVIDHFGHRLVALVKLVADKSRYQRLDAARTQRDQEQAGVEAGAVVLEHGQAGVANAVQQGQPQHGVVLAEEAVGDPAAKQRKEVHANDEGVEHILGNARTFGDRQVQQQGSDQERREDVAHAVETEAFAGLVADDVGDLAWHASAGLGGGGNAVVGAHRHCGIRWFARYYARLRARREPLHSSAARIVEIKARVNGRRPTGRSA